MPAANFFEQSCYLSAAECGPEQRMQPHAAIGRCIDIATAHANALGIGYDALLARGQAWVLSRIVIEMERYPEVNEQYCLQTWVESFNRSFSNRCFRFVGADGRTIGWGRSVWVAIDIARRTMADLSHLSEALALLGPAPEECPIRPVGRHGAVGAPGVERYPYQFRYSDLDSNRHVTTVRYVELVMDCRGPEFHDSNMARRVECSFMRESLYGEQSEIVMLMNGGHCEADIAVGGEPRVHLAVDFQPCGSKKCCETVQI